MSHEGQKRVTLWLPKAHYALLYREADRLAAEEGGAVPASRVINNLIRNEFYPDGVLPEGLPEFETADPEPSAPGGNGTQKKRAAALAKRLKRARARKRALTQKS